MSLAARPFSAGLLALLLGAAAAPARADAVVTLCHADNEAGAAGAVNLDTAMAAGGVVRFDCGPSATIRITHPHRVTVNTRLDGGAADRVLLDGGGTTALFSVDQAGVGLALAQISLARGLPPPRQRLDTHIRGSVVDLGGGHTARLILESVEVRDSQGPIYVDGGELQVRHSRFQGNTGAAIASSGSNDIADSSFVGNDTGLRVFGYAADAHLPTVLSGTVSFANHRASALQVGIGGKLDATGTSFSDNNATKGAALLIDGMADTVTLRKTVYERNTAQQDGGAIAIQPHPLSPAGPVHSGPAAVTLANAAFRGNRALQGQGGAIHAELSDGSSLNIGGGRFVGNTAGTAGGAVMLRPGGPFSMAASLFKGNQAPLAAAMLLIGVNSGAVVSNTLVVGNRASAGGGAVVGHEAQFYNVTVADNDGGGLGSGAGSRDLQDFTPGSPHLVLHNVIVADNRPAQCVGTLRADGNGASLQSPSALPCPGIEKVAPAMLDTLYAPLPGSPAIGHGALADCMNAPVSGRDVLAFRRGSGGLCSIGAYEAAPTRRVADLLGTRSPAGPASQAQQGPNGHP